MNNDDKMSNGNGDDNAVVYREDLNPISSIASENPILGLSMLFVGSGSIVWGILARYDTFGDINERWPS